MRTRHDPSTLIFAAIFIAAAVISAIASDRTADQDAQLRCRESGGVPVEFGDYGWHCRRMWEGE